MTSFLLELFSEEIPARMQTDAERHLKAMLLGDIEAVGFGSLRDLNLNIFSSPRRLGIIIQDLPEQIPPSIVDIKGPKVSQPESAIQGFLKKNNLTKQDLILRDDTYFGVSKIPGKKLFEVLPEIINRILSDFPWPKSMRWGSREESWVRPLHSILCILGSEIIPVEFAGIKAGNTTYGHRFLAPQAIQINDASEYLEKLKSAFVIADREERKASIKVSLNEKAAIHGFVVKDDPALLEEVTGLVEWPVVMIGKVDEQFMHLPPELLTTVMRSHQKYFTLNNSDGTFSSSFAFVANRDTKTSGAEIIAGNERVLRARFSDAKFFYEQDQKQPLVVWNKGLEKVTFHAKIGTVKEKVERIVALGSRMTDYIQTSDIVVQQVAGICKADLTTGMVGEFPELQGIMGSYYAKAQGDSDAVAEALYHLYDHPKDLKNLGPVAQILCIADRLDTLISLFAIGEKPTGSKDPYALRRAALGVIAIIKNHDLRFSLSDILTRSEAIYDAIKKTNDYKQICTEILEFFNDRFEADLLEQGIERTTLRAIGGLAKDSDIARVIARAEALQKFLKTEDGANLLAAYKRAANILTIEEKAQNKKFSGSDYNDNADYITNTPDERALRFVFSPEQNAKFSAYEAEENYIEMMRLLSTFRGPMDNFFQNVMVKDKDASIAENRMRLLAMIVESMNRIADFSKIS